MSHAGEGIVSFLVARLISAATPMRKSTRRKDPITIGVLSMFGARSLGEYDFCAVEMIHLEVDAEDKSSTVLERAVRCYI